MTSFTRGSRANGGEREIDKAKNDEAGLAPLYLTLHDGVRAGKSLDCDVLKRLHERGYISNPIGEAKSVTFTEEGLRASERLFTTPFSRR